MNIIKRFKILVLIIFFSFVSFHFLHDLKFHPFHEDEVTFLQETRYFDYFWIKKDFSHPAWQEFLAREHPPISKYLFGLANYLAFENKILASKEDLTKQTDWTKYTNKVLEAEAEILEILVPPRIASTISSIFSCLLIFFIAYKVAGFTTGILACLLLVLNPLFFLVSRRAMPDAPLLTFLILNIYLVGKFLDYFKKRKFKTMLILSSLIGLNSGVGAGLKENGLMAEIAFLYFLFIVFLMLELKNRKYGVALLLNGFLSVIVAGFSFTIFNPAAYKNPHTYLFKMILLQTQIAKKQQKQFPGVALTSSSKKIHAVFRQTISPKGQYVNFPSSRGIPIDCFFLLSGSYYLVKRLKDKKFSLESFILFNTLISFCMVTGYIMLDWDRYYLPLIPHIVLLQSFGINFWLKKIYNSMTV